MPRDEMAFDRFGPLSEWHLTSFGCGVFLGVFYDAGSRFIAGIEFAQSIGQLALRLYRNVAAMRATHQARHAARFDIGSHGGVFDGQCEQLSIGLRICFGVPVIALASRFAPGKRAACLRRQLNVVLGV